MTDRDTFAAAALTGLIANGDYSVESTPTLAWRMADAMLRERDESKPPEPCAWKDGVPVAWYKKTNHDAAPAARANAESVAPQPTAGDRSGNPTSHSGTGKQPAPPSVETDGFSSGFRTGPIIQPPERESPRRECGESSLRDVPQPDNGRAAGGPEHHISEAENANEPVAWAVMERDGFGIEGTFTDRDEAAEWCDSRQEIVPLYRHPQPTLTDAEREAVGRAVDWLDRWQATHGYHSSESGDLATLCNLLERMGGGR